MFTPKAKCISYSHYSGEDARANQKTFLARVIQHQAKVAPKYFNLSKHANLSCSCKKNQPNGCLGRAINGSATPSVWPRMWQSLPFARVRFWQAILGMVTYGRVTAACVTARPEQTCVLEWCPRLPFTLHWRLAGRVLAWGKGFWEGSLKGQD